MTSPLPLLRVLLVLILATALVGCDGSSKSTPGTTKPAPVAKRPATPAAQPGLFDTHASTLGIGGPGAAYALLDLPGVGTVGWRCDRAGRYSVVFAVPNTATVTIRLSAGGRRLLSRDVDPQRHVLGPYVRAAEQTLVVDQNHEPGRILATVQIRFKRPTGSECQVPRTSLELTSHSNSVG